ncbi:MAG TPA: hypothetical protein P5560_13000 [Thermotogota bacterium]|nr:hypothetical protein [Thermotogota bacterium]HRW93863.1 hypothetical protein [Thermotogota bacterium]
MGILYDPIEEVLHAILGGNNFLPYPFELQCRYYSPEFYMGEEEDPFFLDYPGGKNRTAILYHASQQEKEKIFRFLQTDEKFHPTVRDPFGNCFAEYLEGEDIFVISEHIGLSVGKILAPRNNRTLFNLVMSMTTFHGMIDRYLCIPHQAKVLHLEDLRDTYQVIVRILDKILKKVERLP